MYTIFICDDEQKILTDISHKVTAILSGAAVTEFSSGNALLKALGEAGY